MALRIVQGDNLESVEIRDHRLDLAEAEVRLVFTLRQPVGPIELKGRLVGPRNAYASTIEVAYPLRPLAGPQQQDPRIVVGRIVIPEPCFWEPGAPNLYEGPVELWGGDKLLVRLEVSHGLRLRQPMREI
jgi:hypothetical protein